MAIGFKRTKVSGRTLHRHYYLMRGAMTQGVLAEAFRAEAQRLSEVYECTYSAQAEPSGHYQELAPSTGSGLALGLRTSGPAGDLFVATRAHHVGNLEVDESDSQQLVSLMRAAAVGSASTRTAAVFGRKVALRLRFDSTTWALPTPFLIGLFPSRDQSYEPWPKRGGARCAWTARPQACGGMTQTPSDVAQQRRGMQLRKAELEELDRLWDELSRLFVYPGPPMTNDQMTEAYLDALLAGVLSSAGRIDREGLALFEDALSSRAESPALQSILDRIAAVLRGRAPGPDPGLAPESPGPSVRRPGRKRQQPTEPDPPQ